MVQAFVHGFVLVFTEPSCDPGYNRVIGTSPLYMKE